MYLRTYPNGLADLLHLVQDAHVLDQRVAACRGDEPDKHADGGRLPSPVVPEERCDLASREGRGHAPDGVHGRAAGSLEGLCEPLEDDATAIGRERVLELFLVLVVDAFAKGFFDKRNENENE